MAKKKEYRYPTFNEWMNKWKREAPTRKDRAILKKYGVKRLTWSEFRRLRFSTEYLDSLKNFKSKEEK